MALHVVPTEGDIPGGATVDDVYVFPSDTIDLPSNDAVPSAPGADTLTIYARPIAGRIMPGFVGPSGLDTLIQPFLARNKIAWAQAVGNGTTLSLMGVAFTATGTATAASVALTNVHTAMRRLEYAVTTASTSAVAGWRDAAAKYSVGHAFGGFHYVCRFGPSRGVASNATRKFFNGFSSLTSAPTDALQPSTGMTNALGVCADSTDTNWQIVYRTGTGTATKVDTGFAKASADTSEMYELAMFSAPGGGSNVKFRFQRLSDGAVFEHEATTSLPATTTLLAPSAWTSVGGTSSVVGISLVSLYIETDF